MKFKKKKENKVMEAVDKVNEAIKETEAKVEPEPTDEWIWVEGYKGTDKDMKCRDYQYVLGVRHNMPNDADIKECESGFHFCRDLCDVFNYYDIGDDNRYFKVLALVRKADYERYGESDFDNMRYVFRSGRIKTTCHIDKLVARSIVLERELTPDEILNDYTDVSEWSDEYKRLALRNGTEFVIDRMQADELVKLGYSQTFALLIVNAGNDKYKIAKTVATQPDLSMDMKCWMIFK